MKNLITPLSLVVLLSSSWNAFGHSEENKSRYVAPNGIDNGQCNNVVRPCKTIAYAVEKANKGDSVLLASGSYVIQSSEELFYLKSSIVKILGGYNRFDHFQTQSPKNNITTLFGVPLAMADELAARGINAIADGKSTSIEKEYKNKLDSYQSLANQHSETACVNNKAGEYSCNNLDLLAHMPLSEFSINPSEANDIWGHVDLNSGKEYAIIGLSNGVSVVDVSDPTAPAEVGSISGKSTIWRDIKVYQYFDSTINLWRAYAYVTIDGATDYVTIVDLNNLPNSISLVEKNKSAPQAHNVYITNVDYSLNIALPGYTPTLQLIGTPRNSLFGGAFHSYKLDNPETITLLATSASGAGYTHDGASMNVNDNVSCSNNANCTVFLDFNENEMKLWDITSSNYQELSTITYNNVQYTHSGWATEDQQYVFLHDELDEKNVALNTTVRVFSVSDLSNPQFVGQWEGSTQAIDHNGFVRGNRYYMSNYAKGLTVLDISDPTTPVEIGNFDTYPTSNNNIFNGAWGTYPFLPSGNILVSDIDSGLYVIKDNTLSSSQGTLSFTEHEVLAPDGESLQVNIQRVGAVNDATTVTVGYEIIPGSATPNDDYTAISGRLTWENNDNSMKTIAIPVAENVNADEFKESFYVRLFDPKNGATLSAPSYLTVNIDGKTDNGSLSFVENAVLVAENAQTLSIAVARDGNTQGETSVQYQLQNGSGEIGLDIEESNGVLTWLDGDSDNKTITLTLINDSLEEESEDLLLTLTSVNGSRLGNKSELTITITDDDQNVAPQVTVSENFQANTGQTITLTATASDVDNDDMTYAWTQTSGETVTLTNADTLSASFTAPTTASSLTFEFTATDYRNASSSASVTVSVIAPPVVVPPTKATSSSSGGGSVYWLIVLAVVSVFSRQRKLLKHSK